MTAETTRKRILDCALTLFSSRGYDGVGILEICTAAAVTKPTLYYYFSSKDGLYDALWLEKFASLADALTAAAVYVPRPAEYSWDVLPVLVAVISAYTGFAKKEPEFFRILASLMFAPDGTTATERTRKYRDFQLDKLRTLFSEIAHTHGNLTGKETLLAASFLGMIFSYITLDSAALHSAEAIARQFMHGIFS